MRGAFFPEGSPEGNLVAFAITCALKSDLLNADLRLFLRTTYYELSGSGQKNRSTPDAGSELISGENAALILGVSTRTVRRRRIELGGVPVGNQYLYDKAFILEKAREVNGNGV